MHVLVEVAASIVVIWMGSALAGLIWLRHRNRVCPGVPSDAPLTWLASPRRAAVAHRRLRRAVRAARSSLAAYERRAGGAGTDIETCVAEIGRHAAHLDAELVLASRCPPGQRHRLERTLLHEVAEVERLAGRLSASLLTTSPRGLHDVARRLDDRLEALDAARSELDELEARTIRPFAVPVEHRRLVR